jgi:small conductance mechanosensitive channel
MPEISGPAGELIAWLDENGIVLVVIAIALLLIYRWARPVVHRVLVRVMHAQASTLGETPGLESETDKRVETIEDVLARLLRLAVIGGLLVVFMGAFDLWPLVAGLGLIIAGLTVAGQSIILDYLMGILILLEGQYFKGDVIRVGDIEGTVEEVGLRRTVLRDPRGIVHNVSNGQIRTSSNLTRSYAMATVHLYGVADRDVERAIEVLNEAGRELAADPSLDGALEGVPGYTGTTKLSAAGATLRMSGRVRPDARTRVELEMRRRVAAGLAASGIELIRPATSTAEGTPTPG